MNSFLEMIVEIKVVNSGMKNEEQLSDLEDRIMEITQSEQRTESQMKKKKESDIRDLWDNIKHANLCTTGIQKREERKED